jgi:alkanesulfonate monooxygenase SsuD/methylene tetrahydromethanopterin reductase-like flavin-dependent oxidoreductase (luciferase family)
MGTMQVGWTTVWGGSVDDFRSQLRIAERAGISAVGIGDSPSAWEDVLVALAVAVGETSTMTLATMVAIPFLRHPIALARAMSTLQRLSGQRMVCGLGTGASAASATGNKPATQAEMREYLLVVKALLAGDAPTWRGLRLSPLAEPAELPVYYSAWGPKSLEVAAEVADGVIFKCGGADSEDIADRVSRLHTAAAAHGRDPADIDIWAYGYVALEESRHEALRSIAHLLASSGRYDYQAQHARTTLSGGVLAKLGELQRRYDVSQHVLPGGTNGIVAEELGLLDFLAQRTAIAGTVDDVRQDLTKLRRAGVKRYFALAPSTPDPTALLQQLATCAVAESANE